MSNAVAMPSLASDRAQVEAIVRRSGTSFFAAMRCLPVAKRRAMYAIYAFCREVDDIADGNENEAAKRRRLDEWRREVDRLYAGRPESAIGRALVEAIDGFGLAKSDFLDLVAGMEMDAADRLRIADGSELALYCDRVACAVGRLSNRVFGIAPQAGDPIAKALGEALQLTNILRDLKEDAARDRLYLPADRLRAHGVPADDLGAALADRRVAAVCRELEEMAARRFAEADELLARADRRRMRPAVMMMEAYRRLFRRLRRRGWERLDEPVSLGGLEKAWVALRYGFW